MVQNLNFEIVERKPETQNKICALVKKDDAPVILTIFFLPLGSVHPSEMRDSLQGNPFRAYPHERKQKWSPKFKDLRRHLKHLSLLFDALWVPPPLTKKILCYK